jgi:hypothetical protein
MASQKKEEIKMAQESLPKTDFSNSETGCCPRFDFAAWDNKEFVLKDRLFVKASTRSFFHVPLNFGKVFSRVMDAMEASGARGEEFLVLSDECSMWGAQHYFLAQKDVPGETSVRLSGTFFAKVFEGPYSNVPKWQKEMLNDLSGKNKSAKKVFFYYTTCPKCAKRYGKNFVVLLAQME